MSGIRFLGDAAFDGRIYLIPAQHLLAFQMAPARCLPPDERPSERKLLPKLRAEYAHRALCLVIVYATGNLPFCGPASGRSQALVYFDGTAFGLVPNGIRDVTVSYTSAPPRTLPVRHNFFTIIDQTRDLSPCGLQWLQPTGNVAKSVAGCSFLSLEIPPMNEYRQYVASKLLTLQSQVAALITAIGSGSVAQAEAAWVAAHLTWLDIGQDDNAYGAFGELGRQIDGPAAGLVGGTASPDFTGFHKIELDLWTRGDLAAARTDADTLQSLVAQLITIPLASELPDTKAGIANWVLRPHEILEDANRDTLTGNDDYGSGTGLASLTADVAATRELLTLLSPVIDPVAPHLVGRASGELDALDSAIQAACPDGEWVAIQKLPMAEREQIDADTGDLVETLAPIPDLITSTGNKASGT
ncbi:MAG TPA: EfeM/EfeO family lipoprotein [Solirubrobacteraceae bacterium]|nr:EfeM/EfeO family lipoprotein [Solirubrobacteraceae bacterium]